MDISVVDDEPLIHILTEKLIQSGEEGVSVPHTRDGCKMLERLAERHSSLTYVDIKIPGISGLKAPKKVRETSPFTSCYIMTGLGEFECTKQAIKLKVSGYLMKPPNLKTIQETIQSARLQ